MFRVFKNTLILKTLNSKNFFRTPKPGFHLVKGGSSEIIATKFLINLTNLNSYHASSVVLKDLDNNMSSPKHFTKEELKERLSPIQYHVTQEKGTERPFSGKYNKTYEEGIYRCVVCSQDLFSSKTKFDSGCGWPAFNDVLDKGLVKLSKDTSNVGANLLLLIANPGRIRTEVQCAKCDSHLGHVFDDGPRPTGKRFCINSASLDFCPKN